MKKILLVALLTMLFNVSYSQCDIVYATLSGQSSGTGEIDDPLDLETAISTANEGDLIRIGIGLYNISTALTIPNNDIYIEGGFDDMNGWEKTSLAGATTINRISVLPEGPLNDRRLVAIYAVGISGFEIHDITIKTEDATFPGTSTYGMHVDNCSYYTIARCQIVPGNASNGLDGVDGSNGAAGLNGANGQSGDDDDDSSGGSGGNGGNGAGLGGGFSGSGGNNFGGGSNPGGSGSSGGNGANPRAGGAGGGGGAGGESDHNGGSGGNGGNGNFEGGTAGQWGDPGGNGGQGANGVSGLTGSSGANGNPGQFGLYYMAGSQGAPGIDGMGGRGGAGGGGSGGLKTPIFIDDGSGNGGGGGGGGAQGGEAGTGGYGGGASFGIYLYNNGVNGVVTNTFIFAGNPGSGGISGNGGQGGQGGQNGFGSSFQASEIGLGGNGGDGGNGGHGGNGGAGLPGVSASIHLASGTVLTNSDITFDLTGQAEITATYVTFTNQDITFTNADVPAGEGATAWDFGVLATNQFSTSNPAISGYNDVGIHNIVEGGNTYVDFINITCDSVECIHPDFDALLKLYTSTNGANWTNNAGWLQGAFGLDCMPCEWFGVTCDVDGRVTEIDLNNNQLFGTIPSEISNLTNLTSLDLSVNQLCGALPPELSLLTNLNNLKLAQNFLTGCIPTSYTSFCTSTTVSLNANPLLLNEDFSTFCSDNIGKCVQSCATDLNFDGATDGLDFSIFLGNFDLNCE